MELSDEIGGQLQRARDRAGLCVDDVVFQTRIPRSVVEALEAGDFSVFSSPTYAKSFLSQYSQFLKVEADPWLDALQPASFLAGDIGEHLLGSGTAKIDNRGSRSKEGVSWLAPLSFLWLSAAVVVAALLSYNFFEKKFAETPPVTVEGTTPSSQIPLAPSVEAKQVAAEAPTQETAHSDFPSPDDEVPQPPLRARIVR